jgi:hypothetical protein
VRPDRGQTALGTEDSAHRETGRVGREEPVMASDSGGDGLAASNEGQTKLVTDDLALRNRQREGQRCTNPTTLAPVWIDSHKLRLAFGAVQPMRLLSTFGSPDPQGNSVREPRHSEWPEEDHQRFAASE